MTIEALEAEVAKRSLLYRFPMNWNNEQRKERLIGILDVVGDEISVASLIT